ncbi:ADP-ribosylation factor protein 3 [Malassezia cuniculi]|uniref:ADP-ribosylation factor protein 3 n=1 Tax=Malassezia cuniculi TaxID=948313 RepID=A0AAF0ET68_9BASI|nr:ADP-ribosylation factor protein 3 [Malassezia cuniculi]
MYHLLAGLYGGGKTWLLAKLRAMYLDGPEPSSRIAPTVGQNVLDLPSHGAVLHIWDLGGASSMRSLWLEYVPDAHVLAWALDAEAWMANEPVADEGGARYRDATCSALFGVVREAAALGLSTVVLVTKSDTCRVSLSDIESYIVARWSAADDMSSTTVRPDWHFCTVSAATGLPKRG